MNNFKMVELDRVITEYFKMMNLEVEPAKKLLTASLLSISIEIDIKIYAF